MRIPLPPIPKTVGQKIRSVLTSSLPLLLWRVGLLLTAVVLGYIVMQSAGFLVAFFITSIIATFYMDDITSSLVDLWNARFTEVKL